MPLATARVYRRGCDYLRASLCCCRAGGHFGDEFDCGDTPAQIVTITRQIRSDRFQNSSNYRNDLQGCRGLRDTSGLFGDVAARSLPQS